MKIESIALKNFRQYIGTQTISFSTDDDKKVTVLVGDNTAGKTTLIRAFEWCLYRVNGFDDPILLNKEVAQSMRQSETQEVLVSVVLCNIELVNGEKKNVRYKIDRRQSYICTDRRFNENGIEFSVITESGQMKGSIDRLNDDGQTISTIEPGLVNKVIDGILPKDLSSYFFVAGERVGRITDNADLKSAVRGLMGIDVLENAKNHLKKIVNGYNNALKKSGNIDVENAQSIKETKQKQLESIEKQISDLKDTIAYYENEKVECAANLKKYQSAIEDQQRREQLEKIIVELDKDTTSGKANLVNAFSAANAYAFFLRPLKSRINQLMDRYAEETECVPDMTQTSIDYIINTRKICICGTHISEGSAAHQCLLVERRKMPPENVGSIAQRFKNYTSTYADASEGYFDAIESQYKSYRASRKQLGYKREEKQELDKTIGSDDVDVKKLNDNYNDAVRKLEEKNSELRKLFEKQGSIKKEIDNCDKTIKQFLKSDKVNSKLKNYLSYAQALLTIFNDEYTQKESSVRGQLEMKVNSVFNRVYHGTRTIMVNTKYQVQYLEKLDESDGLKAVKNLSFISGLIELAKEDMEGSELVEVTEFPLVIDAPFSNIDGTHIKNICSIIPRTADQVIIAVIKEHWESAKREMEQYTGFSYIIKKDVDSEGKEKETATHIEKLEV